MTRLNVHSLKNLDPTDTYAAGSGYQRLTMFFKHDPMVAMLTLEASGSLANAIFSAEGLGNETLSTTDPNEIQQTVARIINDGPLCFVGEAFKGRVGALTVLAVAPEDVPADVKARFGYPVPVDA